MGITPLSHTMKLLLLLSLALAPALASTLHTPVGDLGCNICIDIMTDLDEWLTDEKTEEEIVTFVKEICHALGQIIPGFEATCNFLIESQLPGIIDGLVNDNLDPETICTENLWAPVYPACSPTPPPTDAPTTAAPAPTDAPTTAAPAPTDAPTTA